MPSNLTRREMLGVGATIAAAGLPPSAHANPIEKMGRRAAPKGFLWGTAISAYQSEGNNTNADAWLMENIKPTLFKDRSGDACDSYHRYPIDHALAKKLGFNCYRLGLEWARIEPTEGYFSVAELDHYRRVLESCLANDLRPVVTFNHFTTPRWFAERGGFTRDDAPDLFASFCSVAAEYLGAHMHLATTFNEANILQLVALMPQYEQIKMAAHAAEHAAAKATDSPRFSRLAFADAAIATPILQEAHRRGHDAIKQKCPQLPVGVTLTTQDIQSPGRPDLVQLYLDRLYDGWVDVARSHADFFGVQTYTRLLVDDHGLQAPPQGAELTKSGYEFYPEALGNTIRWAHRAVGKPIYVTENGIATDDDARRIVFIDRALASLRTCLQDGIPVHSYLYWSLLDNFEWTSGYGVKFGLCSIDRNTFKRSPRPSAFHLGGLAQSNLI